MANDSPTRGIAQLSCFQGKKASCLASPDGENRRARHVWRGVDDIV